MSLSHCEYCGATLDLSISSKCPNCGGGARKSDQGEGSDTSTTGSSSQGYSSGTITPNQQPTPDHSSSSAKNIKWVCLLIGGVIVFFVIVGILYSPTPPTRSYQDPIVGTWQGGTNNDGNTLFFTYTGDGTAYRFFSSNPSAYSSHRSAYQTCNWKKESSNQYSLTCQEIGTTTIIYNSNNDRLVSINGNEFYRRSY